MATVSGNPDTGGTFTQPVPFSDGQAGHFAQTGGLGTNTAGGTVGVGDGWYSYNLGSWHIISLNIECETQPGGCSDTGTWFAAELEWLKKDLEENHSACTLAYWHQPVFSATDSIAVPEARPLWAFWQLLYQYGADLVLNGHDHLYATLPAPLTPTEIPIQGTAFANSSWAQVARHSIQSSRLTQRPPIPPAIRTSTQRTSRRDPGTSGV